MERKRYSRSALFAIRDAKHIISKPEFANNTRLAKLGLWRVDSTSSVGGGTTSTTPTPYAVDHLMPAFAKKKVDQSSISQTKEEKPIRRIGSGRLVPRENWALPSSAGKKTGHNKNGPIFDEPEWFSGGPTSQHDTIELRGFEETPQTEKEQQHSTPQQQKSRIEKEKENNFDFGDFMEDVDVSVSKILGNDRKEENSRGKIWFGGNETISNTRQTISQNIPSQITQSVPPSNASIQPQNLCFMNFLRKEPEITSVEELEAKMRLAEVNNERLKKQSQPDSDAFRKLLEQLGPGSPHQPHLAHQTHQMHFSGGTPMPGDFFINRQEILKTPEAQVLVQSFLKGELTQQDLFHIQKLNPNKHDIVGAVIQYTSTMFPPFFHPIHRHPPQIHYGPPMPSAPPLNNRRPKIDSGSNSPTPNLAFTPTSVLRKMTGDIKQDMEIPPPPARMILGCHPQRPMGRPILKQGVSEDFHQMNKRLNGSEQESHIGKMKLLNYQRDGGLSPTSNQLARWFSPELLAQASAGKLPSLNIGQALNLQDFERSMQNSTNSTICNN